MLGFLGLVRCLLLIDRIDPFRRLGFVTPGAISGFSHRQEGKGAKDHLAFESAALGAADAELNDE